MLTYKEIAERIEKIDIDGQYAPYEDLWDLAVKQLSDERRKANNAANIF